MGKIRVGDLHATPWSPHLFHHSLRDLQDRTFQVAEGESQKGGRRSWERRVGAGAAAIGPGRR